MRLQESPLEYLFTRNIIFPHPPSMLKLFSQSQFVQTKVTTLEPQPTPLWSLKKMLLSLHLGHRPLFWIVSSSSLFSFRQQTQTATLPTPIISRKRIKNVSIITPPLSLFYLNFQTLNFYRNLYSYSSHRFMIKFLLFSFDIEVIITEKIEKWKALEINNLQRVLIPTEQTIMSNTLLIQKSFQMVCETL